MSPDPLQHMLSAATQKLAAAGIADPSGDIRRLWSHSRGDARAFEAMVLRREAGEPVSHILGFRAFWNHEFNVTPDVLDPRPDTETLIEVALRYPFERVLDLGTGSGCIVISLLAERLQATGLGIDRSHAALDVARGNGTKIGVDARVEWAVSDWFSDVQGQFDLIVSNPPYVTDAAYAKLDPGIRAFEPKEALTPGGDGLAAYREIAAHAKDHLTPDGYLIVEIGFDQSEAVAAILRDQGWTGIEAIKDINGKDRVILAKNPG